MELTQIKYFLEVAESQHMTKSAEKLHISQPSLTQSIHRLEESVGVPLFASKGRNIVLTEYGKYFQKKVKPIVEALDALPEQMKVMAKLSSETIHLNVLAASTFVTEAVIEYKSNKKNLNFQLVQGDENELYDISITTSFVHESKANKVTDNKSYSANEIKDNEFLCEEKIFLAVPCVEKYKDRTSIRLNEVMEEGFISLAGSKQFTAICDKYCRSVGFKPKIIFTSDNPAAVKNMIMANMGVGFWPEYTWGKVDEEHVRLLEIEDLEFKRNLIISYNLNKMDNCNVVDFFEFMKDFLIKKRYEYSGCNGINF